MARRILRKNVEVALKEEQLPIKDNEVEEAIASKLVKTAAKRRGLKKTIADEDKVETKVLTLVRTSREKELKPTQQTTMAVEDNEVEEAKPKPVKTAAAKRVGQKGTIADENKVEEKVSTLAKTSRKKKVKSIQEATMSVEDNEIEAVEPIPVKTVGTKRGGQKRTIADENKVEEKVSPLSKISREKEFRPKQKATMSVEDNEVEEAKPKSVKTVAAKRGVQKRTIADENKVDEEVSTLAKTTMSVEDNEVEEAKPKPKRGAQKRTIVDENKVEEKVSTLAKTSREKEFRPTQQATMSGEDNEVEAATNPLKKRAVQKRGLKEILEPVPKISSSTEKNIMQRGLKRKATKVAINEDIPKTTKSTEDWSNKEKTSTNSSMAAEVDSVDGKSSNFKISSWNCAGLRAWLKKGGLKFLEEEKPNIFCLQEIKCTEEQMPEDMKFLPGYHRYWLCMPGGYAGVAIYTKWMPINVEYGIGNEEFDNVGRLITVEYEKFFLVNTYVPNSGRKLVNLDARMRWERTFQAYTQQLDRQKAVIICGDMNVAHTEIDLANPKTNTRNAGFTKEEREKMTELLALGFVDTFRHLYPKRTEAYTFWTYIGGARARNVGWRLDYFLVSERFSERIIDNCIQSEWMGSDHCPITLVLSV